MKKNYPITNKELTYSEKLKIISITDSKGITSYANQDFIDLSGFSEEEVLGKNHNVVRHPDMPPEAFQNLWDTVKLGKPWMGIVKNRCKNGDHYWVDAYVTPIYENGKITGYQSVRTLPNRIHVDRADALYKKILSGKSGVGRFRRLFSRLKNKLILSHLTALLVTILVLMGLGNMHATSVLIACTVGCLASVIAAVLIARPWEQAAQRTRAIFDNAIATHVYSGRHDELGQIETTIHALQAKLRTVLVRINDSVETLKQSAMQTNCVVKDNLSQTEQQLADVEQVATAMNQMSENVQEIAHSAETTSTQTDNANAEAQKGALTATEALGSMYALIQDIEGAASVIHSLKEESSEINNVVDVIQSIAEQTNLLALNAAIEAARAGEQGRGFAVVADEVRTLASRTQQSTGEIQKIVENLIVRANEAATMMDKSCEQGNKSSELVESAAEALAEVAASVGNINAMNTHVAAATEQQRTVAEEVNHNIASINEMAHKSLSSVQIVKQAEEDLLLEANRLKDTVWQFDEKKAGHS